MKSDAPIILWLLNITETLPKYQVYLSNQKK